jgi:hypothetical protein
LFSRGPVARPPIKVASDIGVAVGKEAEESGEGLPTSFCNVSARPRLVSVLGPSFSKALECWEMGERISGIAVHTHRLGQFSLTCGRKGVPAAGSSETRL